MLWSICEVHFKESAPGTLIACFMCYTLYWTMHVRKTHHCSRFSLTARAGARDQWQLPIVINKRKLVVVKWLIYCNYVWHRVLGACYTLHIWHSVQCHPVLMCTGFIEEYKVTVWCGVYRVILILWEVILFGSVHFITTTKY